MGWHCVRGWRRRSGRRQLCRQLWQWFVKWQHVIAERNGRDRQHGNRQHDGHGDGRTQQHDSTWSKRGQPEQQRLQPRGYAHQPGHALGEYGAALLIRHSP